MKDHTDHIKEICIEKGIKPVYTKNKYTILSNGSQKGIPTLRINEIFTNCSRETAQALVNYYLDVEKREDYIKQIQKHAEKYSLSGGKIAPFKNSFMGAMLNHANSERGEIFLKSVLTEHSISVIIQKNFKENHSKKITDGTIKVQEDNIAELDIIIEDSKKA